MLLSAVHMAAAVFPLETALTNLEVTCRDILWPEYMKRKRGESNSTPVNATTIITTNELQLIFTPIRTM